MQYSKLYAFNDSAVSHALYAFLIWYTYLWTQGSIDRISNGSVVGPPAEVKNASQNSNTLHVATHSLSPK